jgi:hypothetical protein
MTAIWEWGGKKTDDLRPSGQLARPYLKDKSGSSSTVLACVQVPVLGKRKEEKKTQKKNNCLLFHCCYYC